MRLRPLTPRAIVRAGQRLADHGDRSRHHVDEGAVDLVDLGADIGAEKDVAARSSVSCFIAG